ncbi:hypothetical protein M2651_12950 [Clostridium sp. SYSU_GA19001]|uniref:hypothetical protein n=1 Tax=Clostridium caldaquaticum TaxID=2940653 RepID=UPI0020773B12|nr:hypothetical protein [Clostridium caldaquaticum]MCM8711906.1 hypothetical protein [Clostridium caldaquaticum]
MKKGDLYWALALLVWVVILVVPSSRAAFILATETHPYIGGFIKFSILATMGDMLGARVLKGEWKMPTGAIYKAIIWGIIGMMVTLVFTLFMGGAAAAQAAGRLPFKGSVLAQAFFGSAVMNVTFGPMMMAFHRFTDMYIDTKYEKKGEKVTLKELIAKNDWNSLVEFSWLKTCPFFWIPAHTIVFLLPGQYRVLVSAFLSIALGLLLALAKKGKGEKTQPAQQLC